MEVDHKITASQKGGRIQLLEPYPELAIAAENQMSRQLRVILEEGGLFSFSNLDSNSNGNGNGARRRAMVARRRKRKLVLEKEGEDVRDKGKEKEKEKEDDPSLKNESKTNSEDSSSNVNSSPGNENDNANDNLVKVNIRIRENQISVVDELMVDTTHPTLSNPLFLAKSLASDLKLPSSMITTIAISIAEQICGLSVDNNLDGMLKLDQPPGVSSSSSSQYRTKAMIASANNFPSKVVGVEKGIPSAWLHDEKEECKMRDAQFGEIAVLLGNTSQGGGSVSGGGNSSNSKRS